MPQLIFKGIKIEEVKLLSESLLEKLAMLTDTPKDYFSFECPQTMYFFAGKQIELYPLIEIIQFDRGETTESAMAQLIQSEVKALGYTDCEVYFTHVNRENYYE